MSTSTDSSPEAAKTVKVIGFGLRAAAFLIDTLIIWVAGLLLGVLVAVIGLLLTMYLPGQRIPIDGLVILFGLLFSIAYFVFSWSKSGQTMGKMAVGIKIVGPDGQPPSLVKAVLRYIGYFVSGIALSLGFLWVAFDRKRQGWHDKIASSYVISPEDEFSSTDELTLVPSDAGGGLLWLIVWVIVAVGVPGGLAAALLFLGPTVANFIFDTAKDFM